jgi:hypothetical protein
MEITGCLEVVQTLKHVRDAQVSFEALFNFAFALEGLTVDE